jgi:hypothetical protein
MQSIIGVRLFPMAMFLDTPYEFFSDSGVVESFSRHSYRMTLLRLKKTLRSLLLLESFLGDSNLRFCNDLLHSWCDS